jgi:hypothetical protein
VNTSILLEVIWIYKFVKRILSIYDYSHWIWPSLIWCTYWIAFELRFPHKKCSVRLYLQLFVGGLMSYSRYLCLFVVSNTYCVLFLFYFSSTCVPYVVSFSGLSILIAPFIFSDVYFQCALCFLWKNSWHHVSDCDFAWLHIFNWSEIVFHCFVLVQKQSLSQKMQCQLEMSLMD